jgi:PhnB protein
VQTPSSAILTRPLPEQRRRCQSLEPMTSIEPELWVIDAGAAVTFYQSAFGAVVLHRVGHGNDIVAQLEVGTARFWVTEANANMQRYSPRVVGGTTSRTLLVIKDPDSVHHQAVKAGATEIAPVGEEHGWRMGRIVDPFGHEWEIGRPLGAWPPPDDGSTKPR